MSPPTAVLAAPSVVPVPQVGIQRVQPSHLGPPASADPFNPATAVIKCYHVVVSYWCAAFLFLYRGLCLVVYLAARHLRLAAC